MSGLPGVEFLTVALDLASGRFGRLVNVLIDLLGGLLHRAKAGRTR